MSVGKSWSERLLAFLGLARPRGEEAAEALCRQYIWQSQQAGRYRQQADRMQYPQFRAALRRMADEEESYLEEIARILSSLGSEPPWVPPIEPSHKNSWQYLLENLEDAARRGDALLGEAAILRGEAPAAAEILERIYEGGKRHREAIRGMLMRSDPQAMQVGGQ